MILTSAGNLGIGVASPSVKLEVRGGTIQGEQLYVVDSASYGANQYGLLINAPTSTQGASIQTIQQSVGYNQNLMLQQTGSGYVYLGGSLTTGLRIAGWDTGNTLYQNTGNMGITVNTGNNITFNVGNGGEKMRVNSGGNIGIGTNNPNTRVHIEHASTSAAGYSGGFYLYNPTNAAGNTSVLGIRNGGNLSGRCGISLDCAGAYGWNIGINGTDNGGSRAFSFNPSWDNSSATDRFKIDYSGNVSVNTNTISSRLTVNDIVNDRSSYDHSQAVATFTNQSATTSTTLNDPKPVLNLCRQGTSGQAYGARATFALSRYENNNVWSRSRMDLIMAHDGYSDNTVMIFYSNGEASIASRLVITGAVTTNYNLNANSGILPYYSGFGILYWGAGAGSTVTAQNCSTSISVSLYCYYAVSANTYISTSDRRIKENIKPLLEVEDIITKLNPVSYNFIETKQKANGFIAQEVAEVYPDAISSTDNFLPNILEEATIIDNIITFKNTNNIKLEVHNIIKIAKSKIEINTSKGYAIMSVIDDNTFTILDTEARNLSGTIYLYGMLVKDYMSIDYNQITTLNTKGIQNLYSIIEEQQKLLIICKYK